MSAAPLSILAIHRLGTAGTLDSGVSGGIRYPAAHPSPPTQEHTPLGETHPRTPDATPSQAREEEPWHSIFFHEQSNPVWRYQAPDTTPSPGSQVGTQQLVLCTQHASHRIILPNVPAVYYDALLATA